MTNSLTDGYGRGGSLLTAIFGPCSCRKVLDCSQPLDRSGGILLWFSTMFYMLKALGTICEDYLVPSLERLSNRLKLSPDFGGATILALGASAPEFAASVVCTFVIVNEGALGMAIGSAMFSILFINGIVSYAACSMQKKPLDVWHYPVLRDLCFYLLAMFEVLLILADGEVKHYEAFVMVITYTSYCVFMKFNQRVMKRFGISDPADVEVDDGKWWKWGRCPRGNHKLEPRAAFKADGHCDVCGLPVRQQAVVLECAVCDPRWWKCSRCFELDRRQEALDLQAKLDLQRVRELPESAEGEEQHDPNDRLLDDQLPPGQIAPDDHHDENQDARGDGEDEAEVFAEEERSPQDENQSEDEGAHTVVQMLKDPLPLLWSHLLPRPRSWLRLASLSAALTFLCMYLALDAAFRIGEILRLPPRVMGMVFLAAGSSMSDALGSLDVANSGESSTVVANAFGSPVFDLLFGLGFPWLVRTTCLGQRVEFREAKAELTRDLLIAIVLVIVFMLILTLHGFALTKRAGAALVVIYALFTVSMLLTGPQSLES